MGFLLRIGFGKSPAIGDGPMAVAPAPPSGNAPPARRPVFGRGHRDSAAAVAENLRLIFNTKEGYGWFLPGFGLGNYFASPAPGEALSALVAELEANVRRFEVRLVDPEVAVRGRDESWISLQLTGRLAGRDVVFGIQFNVSFGSVRVEVEDDGTR